MADDRKTHHWRPEWKSGWLKPEDVQQYPEISLEIGCGVGWHPIRWARENPGRLLLAFERTEEKFGKFQGRLEVHEARGISLSNLRACHADATHWLAEVRPGRVFSRVFILYPNPYPKPKHADQRWFSPKLSLPVLDALRPGAEVILATNLAEYADGALRAAQALVSLGHGSLELIEDLAFSQKEGLPPGFPRTHFEKKYLLRGETCRNLRFRFNPPV